MAPKRIIRHLVLFSKHVVPAAVRPARTLWNEIIGFLFLSFAFIVAAWSVKDLRHIAEGGGSLMRFLLAVIFVVIMTFYGVASFRKARRISRS